MKYSETTQWLFSQLPRYQNVGKSAYKADLGQTLKLAKQLNHPEHKFKSIHVGGTNGKGSTAHMLASILQEAGYKVGLYTSPAATKFLTLIVDCKTENWEWLCRWTTLTSLRMSGTSVV